jgi:hypothetical protein
MLAQCTSNLQKVVETYVAFPTLYTADISWVQMRACSQFLLRPSFCKSQLPDLLPESASI